MVSMVLRALERSGIPYCILHGGQASGDSLDSDLDIAIRREDVGALSNLLCVQDDLTCVQVLQHESSCRYFVLAAWQGGGVRFLRLDVATDYRRNGRIFLSGEELLGDRRKQGSFWLSSPSVEFSYLLAKKVLKGAFPDRQLRRLQSLRAQLGDEAGSSVHRLFGKRSAAFILSCLDRGGSGALAGSLPQLRRSLLRRAFMSRPLDVLRYWPAELGRIWWRLRYPTGFFVAVMGPDGAGKSMLISSLKEQMRGAFRRMDLFHLRPRLLRAKGGNLPTDNPHGVPTYSAVLSRLKLAYLLLDYVLGFALKIAPKLARSSLVLFDRYYDDLLVDPRRYRYGGHLRLVHVARRLVPRPDLFLFLDVPEELLLARKPELPLPELRRQRAAYCSLAAELPNAVILDGSSAPEELTRMATEEIVRHLGERQRSRLRRSSRDDRREALRWLAGVLSDGPEESSAGSDRAGAPSHVVLSAAGGRHFLLPCRPRRAAARALQLYRAQKPKARAAKTLLAAALRGGIAQPFLKGFASEKCSGARGLLSRLESLLGQRSLSFAVSLGTPGPERKPVIQVMAADGRILAYAKVGWSEATRRIVRHEAEILHGMAGRSFDSFVAPEVRHLDSWNNRLVLVQSAPEGELASASRKLTDQHIAVVNELKAFHLVRQPLKESGFWQKLARMSGDAVTESCRQLLAEGTGFLADRLGGCLVPFHFCHGDFTPWNMVVANGRLLLFDWENADREGSPGFDLFHFFYQSGTLLYQLRPSRMHEELMRTTHRGHRAALYFEDLAREPGDIELFLLLYLMDRLAFCASRSTTLQSTLHRLSTLVTLCMGERTNQQ